MCIHTTALCVPTGVAIELTTSLNEDHFTACFSGSMEANYECRLSGSGQWHHCEFYY